MRAPIASDAVQTYVIFSSALEGESWLPQNYLVFPNLDRKSIVGYSAVGSNRVLSLFSPGGYGAQELKGRGSDSPRPKMRSTVFWLMEGLAGRGSKQELLASPERDAASDEE